MRRSRPYQRHSNSRQMSLTEGVVSLAAKGVSSDGLTVPMLGTASSGNDSKAPMFAVIWRQCDVYV